MAKNFVFHPSNMDPSNEISESYAPSDSMSEDMLPEDYWQMAINVADIWLEYKRTSILYQKVTNHSTRYQVWPTVAKYYNGKPSLVRQREYRLSKKFGILVEVFESVCKAYHVKAVGRDFFMMNLVSIRDCKRFRKNLYQKRDAKAPALALDELVRG